MRILILEDNADRRTAMLEHIADYLPMFGGTFFETSESMIDALKSANWNEIALISLDNDLDPIQVNGRATDAGYGLAVARFLVEPRSMPVTLQDRCERSHQPLNYDTVCTSTMATPKKASQPRHVISLPGDGAVGAMTSWKLIPRQGVLLPHDALGLRPIL